VHVGAKSGDGRIVSLVVDHCDRCCLCGQACMTQVLDLLKNSHMKEASESIYTVVHSFSAMECGSSQSTKWEDKAGH
jgi:hypothetical protein